MVFNRDELKRLIQEKGISNTDDLNSLMRDMTKEVVEALYDGELTAHLGHGKNQSSQTGNIRNGHTPKRVKTRAGEVSLDVPRDRQGTFSPQIVKKRQRDITGMEEKVISMYGLGMSTRDIQAHIDEIYGYNLSPETISTITDSVLERAKQWQNRSLDSVYSIIFMDALVIKLKQDRQVKNAVVYGVIGISMEGHKECLGLYLSREPESSAYWLSVMNELKNRGVQDIMIFSVDNLAGISEAIESAFPHAQIQKCVVHQIRNSLKHVPWNERKRVAADLRQIYTAHTEEAGKLSLADFEARWNNKYPHIAQSWHKNWAELSTYFEYSQELRRLIYTTNPIESFNRSLRKVSRNRPVFQTEDSVSKLFYLAVARMQEKWTVKIRNWGSIYSQLMIQFESRLSRYL